MTKTKERSPVLIEPVGGGWAKPAKEGDIVTPRDPSGANYGGWRELKIQGISDSGSIQWIAQDGKTEGYSLPEHLYLTTSSELQALTQLESIREMVAALKAEDDDEAEKAREAIQNDALSVQVRSDWVDLNQVDQMDPAEFKILLCTGGPAVQIIGELNEHSEPESARLQHQDWGTPWTDVWLSAEDEETLLAYCREFYFGE